MRCETPPQGKLERGLSARCDNSNYTSSALSEQSYSLDLPKNISTLPGGATSAKPAKKRRVVSERTRPDLGWTGREKGTYIVDELFQSDAFRTLTGTEKDICLFMFTRRKYLKHTKKTPRNTWEPSNRDNITLPYPAIKEFFTKGTVPPPNPSTVSRAINALMAKGFLDVVKLGGNGPGDMTIYRLTYEWREWRTGDPSVYSKAGLTSAKGFCHPGTKEWCPAAKQKRGANSHG